MIVEIIRLILCVLNTILWFMCSIISVSRRSKLAYIVLSILGVICSVLCIMKLV